MGKINLASLTGTGVAGINYSAAQTTTSINNGAYFIIPNPGFYFMPAKAGWGTFFLGDDGTTQIAVVATAAAAFIYADGTRVSIGNVSAGASQTTTYYQVTGL